MAKTEMAEGVLPLADGYVVLRFPRTMSWESFEELCDWIALMRRVAARTVRRDYTAEEAALWGGR